jgi:hypothetical protein
MVCLSDQSDVKPGRNYCAAQGEKRRLLAIMFYNTERQALEFDRAEGVELQEFIDIVRLYLKPDYGK